MCILLLSTAHPEYDLILLSNRDEYFSRPTEILAEHPAQASNSGEVYIYGRDSLRGGTWLAVSTSGRFAALTNFKTPAEDVQVSPVSRGSLPLSFLASDSSPSVYAESLLHHHHNKEIERVGGFSLLCGDLRSVRSDGVVVVSNKSAETEPITTFRSKAAVPRGEGIGSQEWSCELSNSLVSVRWPKVKLGRDSLRSAIQEAIEGQYTQDRLIESLFSVLSRDTIKEHTLAGLAESVFIPQFSTGADVYGTRQQTVWLLKGDTVTIVERTIQAGSPEKKQVMISKRIG